MTNNTKKQFGIILAAIASIGAELMGELNEPADVAEPVPAPKKRGRPAADKGEPEKTSAPAEPAPEPPAEPAPAPEGMTTEALRELIAEPVKDGQGEAVKALIVKHGGSKLSDIPAANHLAFAKDVEALTF